MLPEADADTVVDEPASLLVSGAQQKQPSGDEQQEDVEAVVAPADDDDDAGVRVIPIVMVDDDGEGQIERGAADDRVPYELVEVLEPVMNNNKNSTDSSGKC